MRDWKSLTRIALVAAFVFTALLFLLPDTGSALYVEGGEWVLTPAAQDKTQQGDCGTSVCRELCIFGTPTGEFMCFGN